MKHTIKKVSLLVLSLVMVLTLFAGVLPKYVNTVQAAETTPDLKVGVLSDVHLGYFWDPDLQTPRFYKALKAYKEMGVDAILIAGDLNDQGKSSLSLEGQKAYMEEFADVWFSVFPEAKGEEGYVEPILIYGNHDEDLIAAGYWPARFGTYSDVQTWEVNGYHFVGVHNSKENKVTTEVADAVAATPDKPVFYIQHCPIAYTVGRSIGGYGYSYSTNGRKNIRDYSNVVSFAGHNHMPLTDERSIWQGESWNDGQFTAINTASLNYGDADANEGGINGASTATQHGMLMTVTGSEVSIERFSFEGLSVDMSGVTVSSNSSYGTKAQYTNVSELSSKSVSGSYVKIGKTWSFDACDVSDRPYTYSARLAAAKTPVFNEGELKIAESEAGDGTRTLTVTVPAATVANPSNGVYRDIIHNYIVEACDPLTGNVEAFGTVASEFHIDDDPARLSESYTVEITGLEPGKTYRINAYARENFQKRSEPLTASHTCTGTLESYRIGDMDRNGIVDTDDLVLLNQILSGEAAYTVAADVDGNKIVEKADAKALENLLAGKELVTDEGDLLSGAYTPAWDSATAFTQMQTAVGRGDSDIAYNAYAIAVSSWPDGQIFFAEPQDWSNKNVINFDILFENEYKTGEYTNPTRQVRFYAISGANKERSTGYLSRESFDSNEEGWVSYTLDINTWGNVDWSHVYGLLLDINFDGASNRYDGTTPHGFYLDNVTASLINGRRSDDDILGRVTTVEGGKVVYNAGDTRNSYQAIKSTAETMTITLAETYKLARFKALYFDNKLSGASSFTIQAVDGEGNLLGKAVTVNSFNGWNKATVNPDDMELDSYADVAKLQIVSSGTVVIDNLSMTAKQDPDDLLANATMNSNSGFTLTSDWFKYDPSCFVVNGDESVTSWRFISMQGSGWPTAIIDFDENLNLADNLLQFDIKFELNEGRTDGGFFQYYLLDAEGTKLCEYTTYNGEYSYNEEGWATVQLDLSAINADLSTIKTLAMRFNFDAHANVYVDNMKLVTKPDDDLIGLATSIGTSGSTVISITDEITNGSSYAFLFDNSAGNGNWTWGELRFSDPVDLSASDVLMMDVKRTGVYPSGGSERQFRVYLYDSEGNLVYCRMPTIVDCDWSTLVFDLRYTYSSSTYVAVNKADLADIASIRIQFYSNAGEVTVVDNMTYGAHADNDLISNATAWNTDYTVINFTMDNANGSAEAVQMPYVNNEWPKFELLYAEPLDLSGAPIITFDVKRTASTGDVKLAFYNSAGTAVYEPAYISVGQDWKTITYDLSELSAEVLKDIVKIRVFASLTFGDSLIVDNLYANAPDLEPDTDMLAKATVTYDNSSTCKVTTVTGQTNNSNYALLFEGNVGATSWPKITLTFDEPIDLSNTPVIRLDAWKQNMGGNFNFTVYNEAGAVFNLYQYNIVSSSGWATYDIDMSVYRVNSSSDTHTETPLYSSSWANYYKTDLSQLKKVTKIVIQVSASGTDKTVAAKMLLDNMYAVAAPTKDNLLSNATVTAPNYFAAGFEPTFVQEDGRSDVLYLHSDPAGDSACTHSNGWAGFFKIQLDGASVDSILGGGYAALGKKALSFDIKYSGLADTYVGVKLFNAEGTVLGVAKSIRPAASNEWTTCFIDLADMSITDAELAQVAYVGVEFNWEGQITGASNASVADVYISDMHFLDSASLSITSDPLQYATVTKPSAWSGANFSVSVTDVDSYTNAVYIYNDPTTNSSYATDGWQWFTVNLGGQIVGYDNGYDLSDYDYLEFYVDFGCAFNGSNSYLTTNLYDVNGTKIGSDYANGTTAINGLHYFRIPLSAFGVTKDRLTSVAQIRFRPYMGSQMSSSGTKVLHFILDDIHFGKATNGDLMEKVSVIRDFANRSAYYTNDGQSGRAGIFTIGAKNGGSSGWVQNEEYKLGSPITVDEDWTVSYDALLKNFDGYISFQILGSDGKRYTMKDSSGTNIGTSALKKNEWYTRETGAISTFVNDTTPFDPSTVKVAGFILTYYVDISLAADGAASYLALDNVRFVDPSTN